MLTKDVLTVNNKSVRISPTTWPGSGLDIFQFQPGDLSSFATWEIDALEHRRNKERNPFMEAPPYEACGGVVYFDNNVSKSDFDAFMRIMGVQPTNPVKSLKKFAAFIKTSDTPKEDGYLTQMRIVSNFGLRYGFDVLTDAEYKEFPEQDMTPADALWLLLVHERERWGTSFWQSGKERLSGTFGGDGNYAREQLSFGFMLENSYYHVYRMWSRAWLVTK